MKKEHEIHSWNLLKVKLKKRFPHLTSADLAWRDTTKQDLFSNVANCLGITQHELTEIIKREDKKVMEREKELELLNDKQNA